MKSRLARILLLTLLSWPATGTGFAQSTSPQPAMPEKTATSEEFLALCRKSGTNCTLVYGETAGPNIRQNAQSSGQPFLRSGGPVISGQAAVILALALLLGALGLWLRFGGAGILLSASPRELKRKNTAPAGWRMPEATADGGEADLIDRIAAMADQREAMILLLRHCLLHAADIGAIRLARSDTERSALNRLPGDLPGRPLLEELLGETELVHYGGLALPQARFAELVAMARSLLAERPVAHA